MSYKKETGECKLEISMTFADDAGEYTIVVRNNLGEASATVSLLEEGTFWIKEMGTIFLKINFKMGKQILNSTANYLQLSLFSSRSIKGNLVALFLQDRVSDIRPLKDFILCCWNLPLLTCHVHDKIRHSERDLGKES